MCYTKLSEKYSAKSLTIEEKDSRPQSKDRQIVKGIDLKVGTVQGKERALILRAKRDWTLGRMRVNLFDPEREYLLNDKPMEPAKTHKILTRKFDMDHSFTWF